MLIIAPWLSYVLYKPEITHSEEVATWAGDELKTMGALTRREWTLIGLVLLSLGLWVFGSEVINATAVGLLAVSLMLALHVVPWKDITRYNSAWNTLVNLATLVVMANGLTRSGFIDWFSRYHEYAPGRILTKRNGDCTGSGVLLCTLPVCQPVCAHRNHAA